MTLPRQLRWGGWWIMITAILLNGANILVYAGYHNAAVQAVYAIGFTGLIPACTIIHLAQARRAGTVGHVSYLLSVLSLAYANVVTFLTLAGLTGLEGAHQTLLGIWQPFLGFSVYGIFLGLSLFGVAVAQAGVLPRRAGVFVALGMALQLLPQYGLQVIGRLSSFLTIGGSLLFGVGLIWIGWALWSGKGWNLEEPGLSLLDRKWGAPFVILTGLILAVDAAANMFGSLSLLSGLTHLASYTALLLTSFLLVAAYGNHVSWTGFSGFLFTQLGASLYMITAFLILAQLAGSIDNNRMSMASWQDIPVGRVGGYMTTLGLFLLGIAAIRSGTFPHGSGWLVVLGILVALPFTFTSQEYFLGIFRVLGAILEGVGIAWMGWTLRTGDRAVLAQAVQPAR
jgi:hypothetical protein